MRFVMSRTLGYVLISLGLLFSISAYVLRWPSFITVKGHQSETWVVLSILGLLVAIVGAALARRSV